MIKSLKSQEIICSKEDFLQTFESIKKWDSINNESIKKILTWIKYFSKKFNLALDNFNELELLEKMKSSEDFFDIWLAKKIEEILELDRELEKHYFEVLNESTLLLKVDTDWKVIYASDNFCDITGYSMEELIWMETKKLSGNFSKEKPKEFWENLWTTVLSWKVWKWHLKNKTKDDSEYWTETTIVPKFKNWEIEYFTVVRTDITETEELKSELVFKSQELQRLNSYLIIKNAELEILSMTDSLTWIDNRRSFDKRMIEEFNRAKRHWYSLSLLTFDIDFFKNINDTYGHSMWDVALKAIAEKMKSSFREGDVKTRVGWEEFSIILPSTNIEEARLVGEKFRKIIEEMNIPGIPKITISLWLSCYNIKKPLLNFDTFLEKADEALYLAKETGRNNLKTCEDLQKQ